MTSPAVRPGDLPGPERPPLRSAERGALSFAGTSARAELVSRLGRQGSVPTAHEPPRSSPPRLAARPPVAPPPGVLRDRVIPAVPLGFLELRGGPGPGFRGGRCRGRPPAAVRRFREELVPALLRRGGSRARVRPAAPPRRGPDDDVDQPADGDLAGPGGRQWGRALGRQLPRVRGRGGGPLCGGPLRRLAPPGPQRLPPRGGTSGTTPRSRPRSTCRGTPAWISSPKARSRGRSSGEA